ncbi:MAG: carboxypeptidase regulatory-like domain-containing protein, partial [Planctomycetaceae bacterium]|nr:carboxypeptidase regulatory-like domain-containing protein [Planctomycetaceae bacterium]
WLATLLRNTAWKARRAEDRRGRREGDAPSPSPAPSPADLVAEAETHERVVRAVLSLEEPFRSTVLLRWFEDLPPQEMSRRLGVPPDTVKSRLRRAQESLRAKLTSEEEGDARRWMALLVPLARAARPGTGSAPSPPDTGPAPGPTVPATAATAASGGIAMAMGSKAAAVAVAAAALLFLAGGTAFLLGRDLGEAAGPVVPPGHRGPMPPAAEGDAPSSPGAALDPGPPDRAALLEITVTDLSGQPVAGAAASLHLQPREEIARHALHAAAPLPAAIPALRSGTTDAGGRCLLEFPDGEVFALVVNATGYAPAAREFPRPGTAGDRTPVAIALERACSLEGVVIDAAGKPVAGAEVRARNQRPPAEPPWNGGAATTGTDGRFRIEGLPPVAQNLTVEYGPLEWKSWQVRLPSTRPLTLRIPAGGMTVLGTVVAEGTGLPVEGASVVLDVEGREPSPLEPPSEGSSARARVVTGEDGTFRVEGVVPGRIAGVSVLAEGFLPWPARTANVARTDPTPAGGTATVEVRLR